MGPLPSIHGIHGPGAIAAGGLDVVPAPHPQAECLLSRHPTSPCTQDCSLLWSLRDSQHPLRSDHYHVSRAPWPLGCCLISCFHNPERQVLFTSRFINEEPGAQSPSCGPSMQKSDPSPTATSPKTSDSTSHVQEDFQNCTNPPHSKPGTPFIGPTCPGNWCPMPPTDHHWLDPLMPYFVFWFF